MKLTGYYKRSSYMGLTSYGWMQFPTETEYREFIEEDTEKKGDTYDRNISTSDRGVL